MIGKRQGSSSLLDDVDQKTLHDALHYMKMQELKDALAKLRLPIPGKKMELINRIMTFIATGEIIMVASIPAASQARSHPIQLLKPDSLMLHGSYKNDAQTRAFFKQLIGPHFHFTAFGIDWLNERWLLGSPPTYQQFATFWQQEMQRRKQHKVAPKDEWAFINFMQRMQQEEPSARQEDLMHMWKELQKEQAAIAMQLIEMAIASFS